MSNKHALIVDDSKSARLTLKKMLEQHKLVVDTASSAEEALDYLVTERPDVIFMDHMMPGMDGLEAVKIIKKDPATATIPIVMYTSKGDEVYVGQARALGAVDVLPKSIAPAELPSLLQRLRITSDSASPSPSVNDENAAKTERRNIQSGVSGETIEDIAFGIADTIEYDLQIQLKRLLDVQRRKFRQDLLANNETLAKRLSSEIGDSGAGEMAPDQLNDQAAGNGPRRFGRFGFVLYTALLLAPSLWFYHLYVETKHLAKQEPVVQSVAQQEAQTQDNMKVLEENVNLRQLIEQQTAKAESQKSVLLEIVEWAVSQKSFFDYNQIILGDESLNLLQELIPRLSMVDFRGVLRLETHIGEFCLLRNEFDELQVPAADIPLESCEIVGYTQEQSVALGERQSLSFANFLANSSLVNNGKIQIELVSRGKARPLYSYPSPTFGLSSGEWNKVARYNNRLEISIIPSQH